MKSKLASLIAALSLLVLAGTALAAAPSPPSVVGPIPQAFARTGYTRLLVAPVYVGSKKIGEVGLACNAQDLCRGYVRGSNPIAVDLVELESGGTATQGLPADYWQPMAAVGQELAQWDYGTLTFKDGAYFISL